ncbi:MAG: rhamnose:proton symporter [Planctomycetes bacterium]|nr:rhamnose:proton symporter [Planctomycetota bacterium]
MGSTLHAFGAISAACCYTPQHKLRSWSWQTYWLTQAAICWLIAPIIAAIITIPKLTTVLSQAPTDAMRITFILGACYGIGGTAFGLAIRHVGYSITYAIAIGLSCVLGTLTGPILKGTLVTIIEKPGSQWVIMGIVVGMVGIVLCGLAGRWKELDLQKNDKTAGRIHFSLAKGLPLCLVAGILSAVYGIAINDTGKPIAEIAALHGAGHWQTNIIYIFANTGAFVTSAIYVIYLGIKEKTLNEFIMPKGISLRSQINNYLFAILTGCLWFGQFLFYGLGHVRMGQLQFSSWAIHMIMLILFSTFVGFIMREWISCRRRSYMAIATAIVVLIGSVLLLTYGNYLGAAK